MPPSTFRIYLLQQEEKRLRKVELRMGIVIAFVLLVWLPVVAALPDITHVPIGSVNVPPTTGQFVTIQGDGFRTDDLTPRALFRFLFPLFWPMAAAFDSVVMPCRVCV